MKTELRLSYNFVKLWDSENNLLSRFIAQQVFLSITISRDLLQEQVIVSYCFFTSSGLDFDKPCRKAKHAHLIDDPCSCSFLLQIVAYPQLLGF